MLFKAVLHKSKWQNKTKKTACLAILFLVSATGSAPIKSTGVSVSAISSRPVGGLAQWFKPAPALTVSLGQQIDTQWFVEGVLEVCRYDKENLRGYPGGRLELLLEHATILVNGRHALVDFGPLTPYFNIGLGLSYWKGIRGEIEANPSLGIPFIAEKVLQEANWGLRTGVGIECSLVAGFELDLQAHYRLIVGDLWPTLQPHIELEGVSGFSSLQAAVGLRYLF
ncbi:hypothetical protein JW992_00125 [candidate division KSB1 bacterium]|nr:hypothetical protein [candidate division KSB1 bacterium]